VGLEFEEGLVATVLDDVANEPGALPLLEHALLELWKLRRGRNIDQPLTALFIGAIRSWPRLRKWIEEDRASGALESD